MIFGNINFLNNRLLRPHWGFFNLEKEYKTSVISFVYVGVLLLLDVSHQEFINYSATNFIEISKGKLVLLDIKGIYNNSTWKL